MNARIVQIYATPSNVHIINKQINEAMVWVWRGWGCFRRGRELCSFTSSSNWATAGEMSGGCKPSRKAELKDLWCRTSWPPRG